MIRLLVLFLVLLPSFGVAQRLEVVPHDAEINVVIENPQSPFLESEMVLLTIHGIYRGAWRSSRTGQVKSKLVRLSIV